MQAGVPAEAETDVPAIKYEAPNRLSDEEPTFWRYRISGPVCPAFQLYATIISSSLVCEPPLLPRLPINPIEKTYRSTAAATAIAMSRSEAMMTETPRLVNRLPKMVLISMFHLPQLRRA